MKQNTMSPTREELQDHRYINSDFTNEPYYEASREIGKALREFGYTRHGLEHLAECIQRHGAVVLAGIIDGARE